MVRQLPGVPDEPGEVGEVAVASHATWSSLGGSPTTGTTLMPSGEAADTTVRGASPIASPSLMALRYWPVSCTTGPGFQSSNEVSGPVQRAPGTGAVGPTDQTGCTSPASSSRSTTVRPASRCPPPSSAT